MGFKIKIAACFAVLGIVICVPLIPYIFNSTPMLSDSWFHLDKARSVAISDQYTISGDDTRWPLVDLLLAFLTEITSIQGSLLGLFIPLLAGISSLPPYCFCRRVGLSAWASLSALMFLSFNPLYSYVAFTGAVMKEVATYFLVLAALLIMSLMIQKTPKKSSLICVLILSCGITLGHHYASLV